MDGERKKGQDGRKRFASRTYIVPRPHGDVRIKACDRLCTARRRPPIASFPFLDVHQSRNVRSWASSVRRSLRAFKTLPSSRQPTPPMIPIPLVMQAWDGRSQLRNSCNPMTSATKSLAGCARATRCCNAMLIKASANTTVLFSAFLCSGHSSLCEDS